MNESQGVIWAVAEGILIGGAGLYAFNMFDPAGAVAAIKTTLPIALTGFSAVGVVGYQKWKAHKTMEGKIQAIFDLAGPNLKLNGKKLAPKLVKNMCEEDEDSKTIVYALPLGYCQQHFEAMHSQLRQAVDNHQIELWVDGAYLHIKVFKTKVPNKIGYSFIDLRSKYDHPVIPIGYSCRGLEVIDPEVDAHALVGGMTGWGKTKQLEFIMACLMTNYTPEEVSIAVVDYKQVDFEDIRPHPMVKWLSQDPEEALELLTRLKEELYYRRNLLKQAGCRKLSQYNKVSEHKLPYIFLFMDEFADISPKIHDKVETLLHLARFVGIHCIICSQRPDRDVLPGRLKANMPISVAFRCKNRINSEIILDDTDAAYLPPYRGRAIFQQGSNWEVQVPLVEDKTMQEIVQQAVQGGGQQRILTVERQGE